MKTFITSMTAAIALTTVSGAALAADLTPLHPALLAAPVYAAHADGARLVAPAERMPTVVTALHPALQGAPAYVAHADAMRLRAAVLTPVQLVQKPE
ncbi:hypothetical protein [Arenibaculum pallidiluteum]|uniref:hypothetical protein n=1 Tax=Arenibaculum pallidiluteum TaxID=2812559 RepID=UPI001A95A2EB|nr:hypothetical protein [Arenibaculum pallidiluteum]